MSSRRGGLQWLSPLVGFFLLSVLVGAAWIGERVNSGKPDALPAAKRIAGSDQPCGGVGTRSSVSSVKASGLPFTLFMPSSPLDQAESVSRVWTCAGVGVDIEFTSG